MNNKRDDIARDYAAAVQGKQSGMVSATGKARFADYPASHLEQLAADLKETSYGCGDPVAFSAIEPGQTVLDLGCGAGLDLILAAEKTTAQGTVIGVDMTEAMLAKAREHVTASGHNNIELRHGTIEALPVADASIDWVISNCVINLSADKPQVFREIARVLKPGGHMLVSDIVAENLPFWVRRSGLLNAACGGGAISEADYVTGLERAGLHHARVLARQYYEPAQMAAVVVAAMPRWLAAITLGGKSIIQRLLERLARPIADKLWSARIYAEK
jgi:SAM-dependent methyltransferase